MSFNSVNQALTDYLKQFVKYLFKKIGIIRRKIKNIKNNNTISDDKMLKY